jgi:hypothetical protein
MKKSFNIQELWHGKSKQHGTKPMHPSSLRAFQRHQEHDLKHPSSVDLITTKQNKTKQNKLPSFIDRLGGYPFWRVRTVVPVPVSKIQTSKNQSVIRFDFQNWSQIFFFEKKQTNSGPNSIYVRNWNQN